LHPNAIRSFAVTRFEFRRDRAIGDSQVRFDMFHGFALELADGAGHVGLGFAHLLWDAVPSQAALEAAFAAHVWPGLDGRNPLEVINRVDRPRGGNRRDATHGFAEPLQIALWDLAAQQAGLPLARFLGAARDRLPAYASGLDFHMTDGEFSTFFARAADAGFRAFKIKVGHPDVAWDLHRIDLLKRTVGADAGIMVDANEAWSPKEAATRLAAYRRAGHDLIWVEDPIMRDDFDGLRALSAAHPWTQVNSGEYLDLAGRTRLLMARATDIINLHGRITEVMRVGWLAHELGIPVAMGNTTLELGVHTGAALPEARWLEYSFQNYDHLVDAPIPIRDGFAHVPDRPGLGFALSDAARRDWSAPEPLGNRPARTGPACRLLAEPA
jgi:L-alanine-DL-glutamate epimerase-like enolase superfamily enzyme